MSDTGCGRPLLSYGQERQTRGHGCCLGCTGSFWQLGCVSAGTSPLGLHSKNRYGFCNRSNQTANDIKALGPGTHKEPNKTNLPFWLWTGWFHQTLIYFNLSRSSFKTTLSYWKQFLFHSWNVVPRWGHLMTGLMMTIIMFCSAGSAAPPHSLPNLGSPPSLCSQGSLPESSPSLCTPLP